jgi:succinate dehydrogenase / fumarate reductase cytochrome b subunit
MSVTTRRPGPYHPSTWTRLREGLSYSGGIGQWSWLLHRLTGLGILLFLIIHIVDTFLVVWQPAWYDHTVSIYGGRIGMGYYWPLRWFFRIGEWGLIASVVFHALNGLRIVLFDFWPPAARLQRELFRIVMIVFVVIMVPVTYVVFTPLLSTPASPWVVPAGEASP